MRTTSFDLFPVHLKVFDFDDDPSLNRALLEAARTCPELLVSTTGKSVLLRDDPWVEPLRRRFDAAIGAFLSDLAPERTEPFDLESYVFFNYAPAGVVGASFTPVHDHLVEADLVAIYYAEAPAVTASEDGSYYAMEPGMLVLHDPRNDARLDRRNQATRDHFKVPPRPNRLVVHPAGLRHSVTPSDGAERLAVTCTVAVDRRDLFEGYVRSTLTPKRRQ